MTNYAIQTHSLCKAYGKKLAVDHIDLAVEAGQIYGLVGKNGAGKTTLIRMLTGQTIPTSGEMELFGASGAANLLNMRHKMGVIVETPAFFPFLSASQNLEYYRIQRGIPGVQSAEDVLHQVGLDDAKGMKFKNFSLGMKQRLGLALALMSCPSLLLLDEPINGLDPLGIIEFRDILQRLSREQGVTILISSHILSELSALATHYGFLESGRMLEQLSAEELQAKCRDCLELTVDDAARAAVLLEQTIPSCEYEVLPEQKLRVYRPLDRPQEIAKVLVGSGITLYNLSTHSANLEDYFVSLVGRHQA